MGTLEIACRTTPVISRVCMGDRQEMLPGLLAPYPKVVVVADENALGPDPEEWSRIGTVVPIQVSEQAKTLETVGMLCRRLAACGADRQTFLLGLGGGITCDLAGFTAATYMRGIRFGFVPTTLLAQVDASVGGKNGVNLDGYKNMVGTFAQPAFVLCDPAWLETLPEAVFRQGLSEVVKAAAIADEPFFSFLEHHAGRMLARDAGVLLQVVRRCVEIKARVVAEDEKEAGPRRLLNFGHTFAHAVEKHTGMPHGEAVSIGMMAAARLSVVEGWCGEAVSERLNGLCRRLQLPVTWPPEVSLDRLCGAVAKDKKHQGDGVCFVLLNAIGRASVRQVAAERLARTLERAQLFI